MKLLRKKQRVASSRRNLRGRRRSSVDVSSQQYAFRRNRTLTGSLSSEVKSANEYTAEFRSSRLEEHHLRRYRKRLMSILIAVLVAAGMILWLVWHTIVSVSITVGNGAAMPLQASNYVQSIQKYLTAHPLQRNRLLTNTAQLTGYLRADGFTAIKTVTLDPHYTVGSATFLVEFRHPVVSWRAGSTQLFVDAEGVSFRHNFYKGTVVSVVDKTGIQAVGGTILASNRFLSFVGQLVGRLHEQGYTVTKIILPENTTRQVQAYMKGVAYPVKFSIDRAAAGQAEDAARAIRYLKVHHISTDYLDVRVARRAYYR